VYSVFGRHPGAAVRERSGLRNASYLCENSLLSHDPNRVFKPLVCEDLNEYVTDRESEKSGSFSRCSPMRSRVSLPDPSPNDERRIEQMVQDLQPIVVHYKRNRMRSPLTIEFPPC
jgi:hypothetical protein